MYLNPPWSGYLLVYNFTETTSFSLFLNAELYVLKAITDLNVHKSQCLYHQVELHTVHYSQVMYCQENSQKCFFQKLRTNHSSRFGFRHTLYDIVVYRAMGKCSVLETLNYSCSQRKRQTHQISIDQLHQRVSNKSVIATSLFRNRVFYDLNICTY